MPRSQLKKEFAYLIFALLFAVDAVVWWQVWHGPEAKPALHFLDVGQGDATLLALPHGVKMLTDTGPDRKILSALEAAVPGEQRLDLVLITHAQADHGKGLEFLLDRYAIGAVLFNGRDNTDFGSWKEILESARARSIPLIVVREGDAITYGETVINVLSPSPELVESAEPNDTAIVQKVRTRDWTALLTADIGFNIEELLEKKYDLRADILKAGHHGSKFSSGAEFLREVRPRIVLIGVGEHNRYGHPGKETLERIEAAGAKIFRTDQSGTIDIARVKEVFTVETSEK